MRRRSGGAVGDLPPQPDALAAAGRGARGGEELDPGRLQRADDPREYAPARGGHRDLGSLSPLGAPVITARGTVSPARRRARRRGRGIGMPGLAQRRLDRRPDC